MGHWFDRFSKSLATRTSRRGALKLLAATAGAAVLGERGAARAQQAITYPAGWNLVGGPDGSTLVGATGSLYSLQPSDSAYQTFPATTLLQGCWGYWAYFPQGGRLNPGSTSRTSCSLPATADGWAMIGNPSLGGSAQVSGADALFVYDPVNGYQSATSIPVGAGAMVSGAASANAPDAAAPVPTVASATAAAGAGASPPGAATLPPCVDGQYAPGTAGVDCRVTSNTTPTARCYDGTWDYSRSLFACVGHGGVAYWTPANGEPAEGAGAPTETAAPTETTTPTSSVTPSSTTPSSTTPSTCCKTCSSGCACGDSCISCRDTCHQGPGCAC